MSDSLDCERSLDMKLRREVALEFLEIRLRLVSLLFFVRVIEGGLWTGVGVVERR